MRGTSPSQGMLGPETMTVLTDVFLAAAAVYCGARIAGVSPAAVHFYFSLSFFLLALGALTGAFIHAIRHTAWGGAWTPLLWRVTGIGIGCSVSAMLTASLYHVLPADYADILWWAILGLTIIYAGYIWWDCRFRNVVVFYIVMMGIVLAVMGFSFLSAGSPGAKFIVIGILISFGAAAVQRSGFQPARHFNHNDLYHAIQLVGLYFFYKGALLL